MTIPTQDHIAWDQAPNWGKKEKKIDERSELRGSLGRGKGGGASAAISLFPDHRWARFARRYFSYIYFLPFCPTAEPGSRVRVIKISKQKVLPFTSANG